MVKLCSADGSFIWMLVEIAIRATTTSTGALLPGCKLHHERFRGSSCSSHDRRSRTESSGRHIATGAVHGTATDDGGRRWDISCRAVVVPGLGSNPVICHHGDDEGSRYVGSPTQPPQVGERRRRTTDAATVNRRSDRTSAVFHRCETWGQFSILAVLLWRSSLLICGTGAHEHINR